MKIQKLLIAIASVSLLFVSTGCGKKESSDKHAESAEVHEGEAEEHDEHADHGEEAPNPTEPCEHKIPIYSCDECRYEVGVVKLSDSLVQAGLIRIDSATAGIDSSTIVLTGSLAFDEDKTAKVSSPVNGSLLKMSASLGSTVKAGEVLFTVRSAEFEQLASEYVRAKGAVKTSKSAWNRDSVLAGSNALSNRESSESKLAYESAQAELRAVVQSLKSFGLTGSDLTKIESGFSAVGFPVRSPISGTVIERSGSIGEHLDPERTVVTVANVGSLWGWFDISEKDLARVSSAKAKGSLNIAVSTDAWAGRRFAGTISWIGSELNAQTRTVKVRASIANPDGALRAGMFAKASVAVPSVKGSAVVVSSLAVQSDAGKSFVFVPYEQKGYMLRKFVETAPSSGDQTIILSGLSAGEKVVTDGAFLLKSDVLRDKMGAGCAD